VTFWNAVGLIVAGAGAGLTASIAGLASLFSYPALLAVGLPPVTANVTNTVALVFGTTSSVLGSRTELRGRRHRFRTLTLASVVGGLAGGALLLLTPPGSFAHVVPWLIGLGSLSVLLVRRPFTDQPHGASGWPFTSACRTRDPGRLVSEGWPRAGPERLARSRLLVGH
jgi:uncharacterized membrane protein YfcA